MRLSEAKIKEVILHREPEARHAAVKYFADCFSRDPEIMPLAIRAIETYGRKEAFFYVHVLTGLAQTDDTVAWLIRQLSEVHDLADSETRNYCSHLANTLCHADPRLLLAHEGRIIQTLEFLARSESESHEAKLSQKAAAVRERIELITWDAPRCWAELERIAEEGKSQPYIDDIDFPHAERVVEALGRVATKADAERVLAQLHEPIEDYRDNPMTWMEIFLVKLAGEMRLAGAVPLLVPMFHDEEADLRADECIWALAKIGGDSAVDELTRDYATAGWDYRLYAAGVLGHIHSDRTVEECLRLLPGERDLDVKTNLANALLEQFAFEAIEPVRQQILDDDYDPQMSDLREDLVTAATVLDVRFPEYERWRLESRRQRERIDARIRRMEGQFPLPTVAMPAREQEFAATHTPEPFTRGEAGVGRNQLCPCGSGKKFKKCCLGKSVV